MPTQLVIRHVAQSSLAGREQSFARERVTLGRLPANDVVFDPNEDRLVSGRHAELRRDGARLVIADLNSTNGTFVNGRRVSGSIELRDGDVVMLGEGGPQFVVSVPSDVPLTNRAGGEPLRTDQRESAPASAQQPPPLEPVFAPQPPLPPAFAAPPPAPRASSERRPAPLSIPPAAPMPPPLPRAEQPPFAAPPPLPAFGAPPALPSEPHHPPIPIHPPNRAGVSAAPPHQPLRAYPLEAHELAAPPLPPSESPKSVTGPNIPLHPPRATHEPAAPALPPPSFASPPALPDPLAPPPSLLGAPSAVSSVEPKRTIGMNTLLRTVDEATTRERSRSRKALSALAVFVLTGAIGTSVWVVRAREIDWPATYARVEPSVYVVIQRKSNGSDFIEQPQATAWSYKPGLLATNSHVAALQEENLSDETLIARSADDRHVDLRIVKATQHPDYQAFNSLAQVYAPLIGGGSFVPQGDFDVALLEIHPDDVSKQGPALQLATSAEIDAVASGTPIGFLGFPMENRQLDTRRPAASTYAGTIGKAVGLLFEDVTGPAVTHLWAYNIESAGGASGSPVFLPSGAVIGLNAAGDYAVMLGRRLRQGIAYGPRADLLSEVGSAAHSPRKAQLEGLFREAFEAGVAQPDLIAKARFEQSLAAHEIDVKKLKLQIQGPHEIELSSRPIAFPDFDLQPGQVLGCIVIATQHPVVIVHQMSVTDAQGKSEESEPEASNERYVWSSGVLASKVPVRVRIAIAVVTTELFTFDSSRAKAYWFTAGP